jgi:2-polyprenyl-6-methoxyphenol hydroxylase-like FAD-dependent oxidoreductase
VNVGLREAHDLGSRIARILRGGGPHELLGVYDAERRAEWQRLLGESAALVPTDGASPWVREHASKLLPCLPGSGATLEPLAAQLGLALATKGP